MTSLKRKDLIYPELSYIIVGILFEVYNQLGYKLREIDYQRAIATELKNKKLAFKEQIYFPQNYKGQKIGRYYFDFLIENKIVLEIKKGKDFSRENIQQLYSYLKASSFKLGILANFTMDGLLFKRILNIEPNDS